MSKRFSPLAWLGFAAEPEAPAMPAGVMPPARRDEIVTTERALSLSTVYRGIQIHATAVCQLVVHVERAGVTLADEQVAAFVKRPWLEESRSAFFEYTVVSLYVDGNAFWRTIRAGAGAARPGEVVDIIPLNPHEVTVMRDRKTGALTYGYRGETLTRSDIRHLKLLRVPGLLRGLGPIQSARVEIQGALDARDYGAGWLTSSSIPDGVLTTDQALPDGMGAKMKNLWYGRKADGSKLEGAEAPQVGERLRVLGHGLSYQPLLLKPADVQFLETQQFTTTQIARLLGNPASLLLAAVEGNSQTYQNVEQDWIAYARFSLMKPLREIEEAFTDLLPRGQTARFNLDALLRTDTKTRMETHRTAIEAGVYDEDHARAIEGLPPLTTTQRAALKDRTPAPRAVESKK
jgi:HK97 family phage portal protein